MNFVRKMERIVQRNAVNNNRIEMSVLPAGRSFIACSQNQSLGWNEKTHSFGSHNEMGFQYKQKLQHVCT